jgi:O-antigen/teichoic acid export membrane protein
LFFAHKNGLMPQSESCHQQRLRACLGFLWPFANRADLLRWSRLLSTFVGVQIAVQATGLFAGLLVIRNLSKEEYAIYTIAGSALGLLGVLSDLGVNGALLALGGRVWRDSGRLGQLVNTAIQLRWFFFGMGAIASGVVFFSLSIKAGATLPYAVAIFALLLGGGLFQLNYNIWSVVPRLHAQVTRLQRLDLATALMRLSLLGGALLIFIDCAVAIAINSLGFLLQGAMARHWGTKYVSHASPANPSNRSELLDLAKSQMPNIIFYCLYGQAAVLVISIFGRAKQIAELGALTRLGVVFAVLGSVMSTIVLPRFARANDRRAISSKYIQVVAVFLTGAGGLLGLALLFPRQIVWLLGGKYSGLEGVVGWMVLGALVNSFVGLLWSLNTSKGWVKRAWMTIPGIVVFQVIAAISLDLSTVRGAILFGTLPVLAAVPVFLWLAWIGIRQAPSSIPV